MANVKMHSIYKQFGNTEVLHGVDIEIEDNEFVVFVGPFRVRKINSSAFDCWIGGRNQR